MCVCVFEHVHSRLTYVPSPSAGVMQGATEDSMSPCERLPNELLLRVLGRVMLRWDEHTRWSGTLRRVSPQWRAVHDGACTRLHMLNGVTDQVMHAICGRLPALTALIMGGVTSLTEDGLRAVGGLTTLTYLELSHCDHVTNAVLRELRGHTALTTLYLFGCSLVTDVGVRELRGLTELTTLSLSGCFFATDAGLQHLTSLSRLTSLVVWGCSTTQAGREALKAALPALRIRL